ncbi:MAG: TIGR00282 family metallophosphoesterase [Phycisphaerales bacterium]
MPIVRVALLGDVVGQPGREAVRHAVPVLRAEHGADLVIVNAENARHGRGLHPVGMRELLDAGADALSLGDHYFDDVRIADSLRDPGVPVAAPCNVEDPPDAMRWTLLHTDAGVPIAHLSVIGRLFMPVEHSEPFGAIDRTIGALLEREPDALVIVEMHCEATSEKAACAYHCLWNWPGTVVVVTGTHTHVQTSDARLIESRLAAITDLGMCGAHEGVIGFDARASTDRIIEQRPSRLELATDGIEATGMLVDLDTSLRRAVRARGVRVACPSPAGA